ncbi:MAG: outer membrane protein [Gemmatimonadaceae bacterium]
MKRFNFAAALVGISLVGLPLQARAQLSTVVKPVQFGVAAGAAIPMSDFSDAFSTGYNGTITLGLNPALIPLGIRIDGAYNHFDFKGGGASVHITSATGNLVYKFPSATVSPYAIGGVGLYNLGGTGGGSENDFGWNIGGGISLPLSGFDAFVEARYNQVQTRDVSTKFIPITFGIMF